MLMVLKVTDPWGWREGSVVRALAAAPENLGLISAPTW